MNHDRLNTYICKLKILSKLEPREKIIMRDDSIDIVDYTTYNLARFKKAINFENRWAMIAKLEAMYHDIETLIDNLVNNPPSRTPEQDILFALDRLRHDLDGSLNGLQNLIVTYNTNKSAVSRLETLYERVKILSEKIKNYFENRSTFDRKVYGSENVYKNKNKFVNEFDPKKPELQTPSTQTTQQQQSQTQTPTQPQSKQIQTPEQSQTQQSQRSHKSLHTLLTLTPSLLSSKLNKKSDDADDADGADDVDADADSKKEDDSFSTSSDVKEKAKSATESEKDSDTESPVDESTVESEINDVDITQQSRQSRGIKDKKKTRKN